MAAAGSLMQPARRAERICMLLSCRRQEMAYVLCLKAVFFSASTPHWRAPHALLHIQTYPSIALQPAEL